MKMPRAAATRTVRAASFSMPVSTLGRRGSIVSDLLDLRFAEEAGRSEDQDQHEDGERRDVLVLAREIRRPENLDQPDQQAAEHGSGQGADAAQHGSGEGLDAGEEADEEIDQSV